jgi:hypothetical protein
MRARMLVWMSVICGGRKARSARHAHLAPVLARASWSISDRGCRVCAGLPVLAASGVGGGRRSWSSRPRNTSRNALLDRPRSAQAGWRPENEHGWRRARSSRPVAQTLSHRAAPRARARHCLSARAAWSSREANGRRRRRCDPAGQGGRVTSRPEDVLPHIAARGDGRLSLPPNDGGWRSACAGGTSAGPQLTRLDAHCLLASHRPQTERRQLVLCCRMWACGVRDGA